jgi:hypothetical protein
VKVLANLRINNPKTFQRLNQVKAQLIAAGNNKADYEDAINAALDFWEWERKK